MLVLLVSIVTFVDMDRNCLLLFVKLLESYINLLMCLAKIRLWLIECEEKEDQRRERRDLLNQDPLEILSKRCTEILHITRECDENCINELRMDRNAFALLCNLLQTRGGLVYDGLVTIEEQVAIFLNILAHHKKNRCIQVRFYRSGETVSRYFHRVLDALLNLQEMLFVKPTPVANDCTDSRWKWFQVTIITIFLYIFQNNIVS